MMKRAGINGLIQSGAQKHRIDPMGSDSLSIAARRGILLSSKDGLVWSETRPLRHCRHSGHLRNTHSFAPSSPSPFWKLSCIIPPFRSRGGWARGPGPRGCSQGLGPRLAGPWPLGAAASALRRSPSCGGGCRGTNALPGYFTEISLKARRSLGEVNAT